ncbi:MAG: exonuclease SbcCD subunit D, partial [Muribaculaceae bacterium]
MKILHTADLHLGQTLYQHYERADEHRHFFNQLALWCAEERPDAMVVSGDVFDVQNPSPDALTAFAKQFVALHRAYPAMHIFITAGNHDSPSRLQAYRDLWEIAQVHVVGAAPSPEYLQREDGWQAEYVYRLDSGVVVALPYLRCGGERYEQLLQSILDYAAEVNRDGLPVVMMAHTA